MSFKLVTPPAAEPVSLAEAKLHCRVDISDDDSWFATAIMSARMAAENQCGRAFVTQTWRETFRRFPPECSACGCPAAGLHCADDAEDMELAKTPVASVTSITYVDADGATKTMPDTDYTADTDADPCVIRPVYGGSWPSTRDQPNAVTVEYVAGVAAASVDPRVKMAVLMTVAHWYANRETVLVGTISKEIEMSFKNLLGQIWNGTL